MSKYSSCLFLPFFPTLFFFLLFFLFPLFFPPYTPTATTPFHPSASTDTQKKYLPLSYSASIARSFETIRVDTDQKSPRHHPCPRIVGINRLQKSFQSLSVSTDPYTGHLKYGLTSLSLLGSPQRVLFGSFRTISLTSATLSTTLLCSHPELSEFPVNSLHVHFIIQC